ncbi:Uncharacterized protein APZ42_012344 [Daphnia magna]|uniref:Uncharacterized protein n=1 Tax=Daphnia magna TaxID=35525 RepID=A0A162RXD7_9CRUS|nr:Uncharacterized protein APZ42_012344 [Daphnia magna]
MALPGFCTDYEVKTDIPYLIVTEYVLHTHVLAGIVVNFIPSIVHLHFLDPIPISCELFQNLIQIFGSSCNAAFQTAFFLSLLNEREVLLLPLLLCYLYVDIYQDQILINLHFEKKYVNEKNIKLFPNAVATIFEVAKNATVLYNQSHNTLLCYLNGQSRSQQLEPVNSHHTHTPTTSTARNLSTQSPKSPPVPISHLTDSDLGQGLRMKGIHLFPITSFVKQMWGLIPSLQLPR